MEDSGSTVQAITEEERKWAMLAHLVGAIGVLFPPVNILAPLLVWILKREGMPFVDEQGKEALNFQISVSIYGLVAGLLTVVLIGMFLLPILALGGLILGIIASTRANNGESYRYPLTIRLVK